MTTASGYFAALHQSITTVKAATADPAFNVGYVIGLFAFFAVLVLIYRFVGRWGWFGILIRMGCAILVAFRVMSLLASAAHS